MANSVLEGGRRRRPRGRLLAVVALVLLAAGGTAAYVILVRRHHHTAPAAFVAPREAGPAITAHPGPILAAEPAPAIYLSDKDAFHPHLRRPPRAGMVFDVETGDVLWKSHPLRRLPIASLTKIMTALIVVDRTRPNERVRITRAALHYSGSGVGVLPRGKRVRLEALLNGLLVVSGNDAAIALADHIAGRMRRFAGIMNRRARRLGLRCTHFVSSHGLESANRSCARDLAVLTRLAMRKRRIRRIVRRRMVSMRFPIKSGRLFLYGHNPLIRAGYRGTIGLKTGFTDPAGHCFVGVARRHGHSLAVILLHSPNVLKQGAKLLNLGFRSLRR